MPLKWTTFPSQLTNSNVFKLEWRFVFYQSSGTSCTAVSLFPCHGQLAWGRWPPLCHICWVPRARLWNAQRSVFNSSHLMRLWCCSLAFVLLFPYVSVFQLFSPINSQFISFSSCIEWCMDRLRTNITFPRSFPQMQGDRRATSIPRPLSPWHLDASFSVVSANELTPFWKWQQWHHHFGPSHLPPSEESEVARWKWAERIGKRLDNGFYLKVIRLV